MELTTKLKLTELNALIKEFVESSGFKPNSQRAYKSDLRAFAEFYAATQIELDKIHRQLLLSWLKQSPDRAANRRGTNIRRFLLWLAETKKLPVHPELYLPWQFRDPIPQNPDRPVDLTEDEFDELIYSQDLSLYKRVLMALLLTTGASLEEISALRWQNVSLGKLANIEFGESGRTRLLPLEPEVAELLKSYKKKIGLTDERSFVFLSQRDGEVINGPYLATVIRRATSQILDKEISPTQLHEYSKQRLYEKTNIKVAMEMLGKKKAVSLIRLDSANVDLNRLRGLHDQAFG